MSARLVQVTTWPQPDVTVSCYFYWVSEHEPGRPRVKAQYVNHHTHQVTHATYCVPCIEDIEERYKKMGFKVENIMVGPEKG
jgi:hypothetical protein